MTRPGIEPATSRSPGGHSTITPRRWSSKYDELGYNNWVSFVRYTLFSYGFGNTWLLQDVGDSNRFITILKQRLRDVFAQEWSASMSNSTTLQLYATYKSLLQPEHHPFNM